MNYSHPAIYAHCNSHRCNEEHDRAPRARRFCLYLALLIAGCAGPGPTRFPVAPIAVQIAADGKSVLTYDVNGNGSADFHECRDANGRVSALVYGANADSSDSVSLHASRDGKRPHLLLVLDSVPFEMVRDAWNSGRFRYFSPPCEVISVFPVMTDPALAEFFGVSPCVAVESVHYDGQRLIEGYDAYLSAANAPWLRRVDFHLPASDHAFAYLWPGMWFRYELGEIQRRSSAAFSKSDSPAQSAFAGYCVGTSCLGSKRGRDGHQEALLAVDAFCQRLMHDARGELDITLISDHGHNLIASRRVRIAQALERLGYRNAKRLESTGDVVVPEFGLVSCAAIYSREPQRLARDCAGLSGVELAMFRDAEDAIGVVSRTGEARIHCRATRYRYEALRGDPLRLCDVQRALAAAGKCDDAGFYASADWFAATAVQHEYPDAPHRIWRAFHGLFEHAPDVMLSLEDGVFAGSAELTRWLAMQAVHGNLNRKGSSGFALTTRRDLPPVIRMEDLRSAVEWNPTGAPRLPE